MERIVFFKKDYSSGFHRQLCEDLMCSPIEMSGQLKMYKSHLTLAQKTVIRPSLNSTAQGKS